jgi:hypothetical protein
MKDKGLKLTETPYIIGQETYDKLKESMGEDLIEQGEQPPLTNQDLATSHPLSFPQKTQIVHHSHNLPRCGGCGEVVEMPQGTCGPCLNCGSPLNSGCG